MSLGKALANGALGYLVALAAQLVVFPAVGLTVSLGQMREELLNEQCSSALSRSAG
jgi:hypothetical protein